MCIRDSPSLQPTNNRTSATPTERNNGEIKKALRIYFHDAQNDWEKRLPTVLFKLRNQTNAAIGMTPS